jgi:acyl dehydratase
VSERFFDEYAVGDHKISSGRTITEADVVLHAGQTGDFFPHHVDAEWCRTQPFGQRIAHGTLVFSVAVGLTAAEINPRSMSYGYDHIRFVRPVYLGDTITANAEIVSKRDRSSDPDNHGFVDEKVLVHNQRGEVVLAFVHIHLVERRSD